MFSGMVLRFWGEVLGGSSLADFRSCLLDLPDDLLSLGLRLLYLGVQGGLLVQDLAGHLLLVLADCLVDLFDLRLGFVDD